MLSPLPSCPLPPAQPPESPWEEAQHSHDRSAWRRARWQHSHLHHQLSLNSCTVSTTPTTAGAPFRRPGPPHLPSPRSAPLWLTLRESVSFLSSLHPLPSRGLPVGTPSTPVSRPSQSRPHHNTAWSPPRCLQSHLQFILRGVAGTPISCPGQEDRLHLLPTPHPQATSHPVSTASASRPFLGVWVQC